MVTREIVFYSHRHSLNTLLRAARVPDPLVQQVIEHRTQEMTEHHRHFTLEDLTQGEGPLRQGPRIPQGELAAAERALQVARVSCTSAQLSYQNAKAQNADADIQAQQSVVASA